MGKNWRRSWTGVFLCTLSGTVLGQKPIDTLRVDVAIVEVLRIPTPVQRAPGALYVIGASQLQNGVSPDIEDALNMLPGVKMETRGVGGSRRIQMRSSGLRSPFAVRNIHMLCDGFVLTGAGGTSPIELWNPQWMHRLEVLLGPTGAIFGGGYGGALVASSQAPFSGAKTGFRVRSMTRLSSTGRSDQTPSGLAMESGFSITESNTSSDWKLQSSWSDNPGFRDQESNQKRTLEVHKRWLSQPHILHHVWTGLLQASWDLPGSIVEEQAQLEPTTAPGLRYDAHVERDRYWLAWSRTATHQHAKNGLWAFAQASDKYNPFGTSPFYQGLKEEQELNGSVRWWRGASRALNSRTTLTWDQSAIARFEQVTIDESDLIAPELPPRYQIESTNHNLWVGSGVRLEVESSWLFDVQLGAEWLSRSTTGLFDQQEPTLVPYEEDYTTIQWAPRIGLSYTFESAQSISLQYAEGSSQPNTFEIVDPSTNDFANLRAEQAKTWELSWKGSHDRNTTSYHWSFNAYHQVIQDGIALVTGENDGVFLDNVEGLAMKGLEGSLRSIQRFSPGHVLEMEIHGNMNRHRFDPLFEQLPGTPLNSAGASVVYRKRSVQFQWNHLWNDRNPLNDALTRWAPAYQRSDVAFSFTKSQNTWRLGMRNVFDAKYSNWLQINAFGGKHYNPAPGRTYWASWVWKFNQ